MRVWSRLRGLAWGRILLCLVLASQAASAQDSAGKQNAPSSDEKISTPPSTSSSSRVLPPGVFQVGHGVTPPKKISQPRPKYPKRARQAKQQGTVILRVIIGEDGLPRDITVSKPLTPDLDDSAVEAVRRWRFKPATKDGRPVAVLVGIEVNFRL